MKKSLLSLSLLFGLAGSLQAQQRYVLYEEFTGENCPPCAATNPGLEALMKSGTNPDNIIMIKYQVPIPSAGPIYLDLPTHSNTRRSYYGVAGAPNAKMDGANSPGGDGSGHPGYLTQSHIDARAAIAAPFNITLSDVSITASGVSATITVNAVTAGTYGDLKLHAALVETLDFDVAPGTNGETHFMNVVRNMYPNANGQDAGNTWTAGSSSTFSISGSFPSSVYSSLENEHFLVVWLQDNDDKTVMQAARSEKPELEVVSESIALADAGLKCGAPNTFNTTVTMRNAGTATLTSATIYYKEESAASWSTHAWTGSLAPGANTTVSLPAITSSSTGTVVLIDSIGNPNGGTDKFKNNNVSSISTSVLQNTDGAFPISSNFESVDPAFTPYATGSTGYPLFRYNIAGAGYDGSNFMLAYPCYQLNSGVGYSILPFANLPAGEKALDFYVAYCQYSNENDKLEVVYSTDCGATWTSIWSKQGVDLATRPKNTEPFIPSSNADWQLRSADLSAVPNGAQIAFRATSNYGNNMFIDNINLRSGPTSIEDIINTAGIEVYPNPVTNTLNIRLNAHKAFEGNITITNIAGQTVLVTTSNVVAGENILSIDASALAAGSYLISIGDGENGAAVKKFVKQ